MHAAHERVARIYMSIRDESTNVCQKTEQNICFIVKYQY